jgi:hypothetical protein
LSDDGVRLWVHIDPDQQLTVHPLTENNNTIPLTAVSSTT